MSYSKPCSHVLLVCASLFLVCSTGNAQFPLGVLKFGEAYKNLQSAGYAPQVKDMATVSMKTGMATMDLAKSWIALTRADKHCEDWGGTANVKRTAVSQCFADPYRALNKTRLSLERLRCIGTATEDFAKKAIAWGDAAAGISVEAGLIWAVGSRQDIDKSLDAFHKAYDEKYDVLIGHLRDELNQIDKCEEKVYGNKNWYNRYGFIYYTMMADRYRR